MDNLTSFTIRYKQNLAPVELRSLLAQDENLQLVDVREYAEFAGGRIPGARLLPLGDLQRRAAELDPTRPVVCVCTSGKRSAQAIEKLVALGFNEVHQLDGGLMAWKQAGCPVEKDVRPPWALERQVLLRRRTALAGRIELVAGVAAGDWIGVVCGHWVGIRGPDELVRNGVAAS